MSGAGPTLCCAQCGRTAPIDRDALRSWKHGELVLAGELDELTASMLLCPACLEVDVTGEYEAGEPG